MLEAGLDVPREIDLGDVARDDGPRVEADPGEEHLHLLDGGVLALVKDDEGVIEGSASHVGKRCDFNDLTLEELVDPLEAQHFKEGVVKGPQVRIDLLREVAREEPQLLACLNRGAGEDDAPHLLPLERVDGCRYRKVGLAGSSGPDAECDVMGGDVRDILRLVVRAGLDVAFLGPYRDVAAEFVHRLVLLEGSSALYREVDVLRGDLADFSADGGGVGVKLVQHMLGGLDVTGISRDSEASSVVLDGDAEALLNLEEVLVSRPAEHGEPVDVLRLKDDFVSFCISQVTFPDGTPSLQSLRNRPR